MEAAVRMARSSFGVAVICRGDIWYVEFNHLTRNVATQEFLNLLPCSYRDELGVTWRKTGELFLWDEEG